MQDSVWAGFTVTGNHFTSTTIHHHHQVVYYWNQSLGHQHCAYVYTILPAVQEEYRVQKIHSSRQALFKKFVITMHTFNVDTLLGPYYKVTLTSWS